tara:strand:+ start:518 stop:1126 length:609 start_codon:yes stop_codon:yes gene_type:complete
MKIKDAIGIFDNVFTEAECKDLINILEEAKINGETYKGESGQGGDTQIKKSTDFNILLNKKYSYASSSVMGKFNNTLSNEYLDNFPGVEDYYHHRIVNGKTYYPLLQIQKYDKGSGHYNTWHVEQEDLRTSERVFVFILYLNDVEEGGETGFLIKEDGEYIKVKPKTGRLIIHPASWPFVHKGFKPESSDKYILTTWLCWNQ